MATKIAYEVPKMKKGQRPWKKSPKGKKYAGKDAYTRRGERFFELVPISGKGQILQFNSVQHAKAKGYYQV